MPDVNATSPVKRVTIEAVVIRADGTKDDLGVISDSKWSRLDPRRLLSERRINRANKRGATDGDLRS